MLFTVRERERNRGIEKAIERVIKGIFSMCNRKNVQPWR